ncbi:hypothetical protein [Synechococcus sp. PCC 6312]|uniref:hypothetical protein n=1 Tax=Synechococcus sp. (strain ATCC 27167 / PCC 6312) TaxID=195253 RepID=UPI00029EF014|nr:hypothetical protein [Synechococcus sp. PCC 6312]AFY60513.1 hypothetical protein Syn6312_1337 [Synechococcus sp. PCC 6312]
MGAEKVDSLTLDSYFYGFRQDAHQLLAWGHQEALSQIHFNLTEEEITGLIVEAMREKLKDPTIPERFYDRYYVGEEKLLAVEGRTGKRRRKLDIVVESNLPREIRPEYIFEAKRLRKNGYPIGKYVGEDGLQCFVKEVYASQYPEAAMVGYVQSDDASYWVSELKRSFDGDINNDLHIIQLLQKAQVLSSIPDVWVSKHERMAGGLIAMYHIFLNCSASSAQTSS